MGEIILRGREIRVGHRAVSNGAGENDLAPAEGGTKVEDRFGLSGNEGSDPERAIAAQRRFNFEEGEIMSEVVGAERGKVREVVAGDDKAAVAGPVKEVRRGEDVGFSPTVFDESPAAAQLAGDEDFDAGSPRSRDKLGREWRGRG